MWQCEIRHEGLHKYRVVKGATPAIMQLRAEMQQRSWNEQWERAQASREKRQLQLKAAHAKETNKQTAAERTREAEQAHCALESLLTDILEEDHEIDWEHLKDRSPFPVPEPTPAKDIAVSKEPVISDVEFQPKLNFITRLIPPIRDKEEARTKQFFQYARKEWLDSKTETERRNKELHQQFEKAHIAWALSRSVSEYSTVDR